MPIAITPKTPEAPVVSKNTKPYYEGSTKTPSESSSGALVPSFSHSVIENNRSDGYWVETFNFSKKEKVPGVIVYVVPSRSYIMCTMLIWIQAPVSSLVLSSSSTTPSRPQNTRPNAVAE